MMVDKISQYTIYESPDGGKTVYARKSGETEKVLHSIDPETAKLVSKISEDMMWNDIRELAPSNEALQKAIDNVILIYKMIKENGK